MDRLGQWAPEHSTDCKRHNLKLHRCIYIIYRGFASFCVSVIVVAFLCSLYVSLHGHLVSPRGLLLLKVLLLLSVADCVSNLINYY